jgi:hypothetical protein
MDPVLTHLLKNARSHEVRKEFEQASPDTYCASHEITVLVTTLLPTDMCSRLQSTL